MKTFVWLIVFFIVCPSRSLRNSDEPLVVDYSEFYFYKHLEEKMTESLSINNCTIQSDEFLLGGSSFPELHVEILSPTTEIRNRWGTKESQLQIDNKVFAQVSDNLCSSKRFKQFKNGGFKLAKGCKEMFKMIDGVRVKQINRYGATLHPGHIRCNVPIAVEICSQRQRQPLLLNSEAKRYHEYPFLVNTTNAIVSRSTMIVLPCGPFGLFSSCEAVKWGVPMASSLVANVENCRQYYLGDGKLDAGEVPVCPFKRERKIFMMSQYDDTQIGQFILESLPRLIYHLDFILENKDVKIHFGFTKQPTVPSYTLPHLYFNWLGLSDRLLNGTYYADQVWMAREGGCQDVSYGAWELLNQREVFLRLSSINDKKYSNRPLGRSSASKAAFREIVHRFPEEKILSKCNGTKPVILILERTKQSKFVQNAHDWKLRSWPRNTADIMASMLARVFPNHEVKRYSDGDTELLGCPPCQINLFHKAEIAIGIHGAGLSNTMYMEPGGFVFEVLPFFDSRHAPVTGIFPRLSAIVGLHHYSYYIQNIDFEPEDLVKEVVKYFKQVRES